MYANKNTIDTIHTELNRIKVEFPELYGRIEHVSSFARQLQVKYRYLADLIAEEDNEPEPKFIKASVLALLVDEVEKLRITPEFEEFLHLLKNNNHDDAPEIFLLILGARPETVVNNAIIS